MKILVTGASGFIGRHVVETLRAAGHEVLAASRRPPRDASLPWVEIDYARPEPVDSWAARLAGVDAVVNAVGIFREQGTQTFQALHFDGPKALFDACVKAGVRRVVQISALGAEKADNAYRASKKAADDHLLSLPLNAVVVRPSIVFGADGTSAAFFMTLASLPVLPLPGGGHQPVQPIHVDDVAKAVCALVEGRNEGRCVPLVGPQPLSLREYLQALRRGLGLGTACAIPMPAWLVRCSARIGDFVPSSLLSSDSWQMLQQGNQGDAVPTTRLLGRTPREAKDFIPSERAGPLRQAAQLGWLLPKLRASLAIVWIVTAIVSMGLYPVADSLELLARTGVPPQLRSLFLYGAASLDLLLGVLTLWPLRPARRRLLWKAQAVLIVGYTLVITLRLPEFWLHPYGPVLKNLPILAVLLVLHTLEPAPRKED